MSSILQFPTKQPNYNSIDSLGPKETAQAIRQELKAAFPAVKFSVVTERGSMVSSVRVNWQDGPTVKAVSAITGKYQAGHFDGMTDGYNYAPVSDRLLTVDGRTRYAGCRYVFTARTISPELANRCIAQLVAYWGGIENAPTAMPAKFGSSYDISDGRGHERIRADLAEDWYTAIHQAAYDRTRFHRES